MAAVGKVWDPREKIQRIWGRDRDAGWDSRRGMLKNDFA